MGDEKNQITRPLPHFIRRDKVPLTAKGTKVLAAMKKQYGAKKGKEVFYASIKKGKLKGVHK